MQLARLPPYTGAGWRPGCVAGLGMDAEPVWVPVWGLCPSPARTALLVALRRPAPAPWSGDMLAQPPQDPGPQMSTVVSDRDFYQESIAAESFRSTQPSFHRERNYFVHSFNQLIQFIKLYEDNEKYTRGKQILEQIHLIPGKGPISW